MEIEDKYFEYALNQMKRAEKERRKYNGYKSKPDRICFYTGTPYAERHEIYGGSNRRTSIKLGFQVDLCQEKHRELHENITNWSKIENAKWKHVYQRIAMDTLIERDGVSEENALKGWMILIGRNYIEELMPE